MDQWGTYDFLLTFHSSHGNILYPFQDIARRWPKKLQIFLTSRFFKASDEGVPLELCDSACIKNKNDGATRQRKSSMISLSISIHYTIVIDRQTHRKQDGYQPTVLNHAYALCRTVKMFIYTFTDIFIHQCILRLWLTKMQL